MLLNNLIYGEMQATPLWKNCCSISCFWFWVFIVVFLGLGFFSFLETICSNHLKAGWVLSQLPNTKTVWCELASWYRNMKGKMRTGFSDLDWFRTTFLRCEDSDKSLSSLQKWFMSYSLKTGKDSLLLLTLHFLLVNYRLVFFVCFSKNKSCATDTAKEKKIMLLYEGVDYKRQN